MAAISGQDIGKALCDALGLSDKKVTNLRLDIPCDGIVTVDATMLVEEAEGAGLVEVLKRYELRERDEPSVTSLYPAAGLASFNDICRMEQMRSMSSTTEPEPKGIKFREFL